MFNHVFKPAKPEFATFFKEHNHFESHVEGFSQEIKKVETDWAYCRLEMQAFATGPPEHIHENFDELFRVEKGTATMLVNGVTNPHNPTQPNQRPSTDSERTTKSQPSVKLKELQADTQANALLHI